MCKQNFVKKYFEDDYICADFVSNLRLNNNIDLGRSSIEELVYTVATNCFVSYVTSYVSI